MQIYFTMTIAGYIASRLADWGVRYVFGIPGGPSIPWMEAFRAAGIEFILVSHESAAGIMADVTARITGVPGVCHATFGPGAANLVTGAGLALLDRSPVLILTSEMPDELLRRTVQMNINHQDLFKPVTKLTFRLDSGNAEEIISRAIGFSQNEYPGPVHIGLPSDLADREFQPSGKTFPVPEETTADNDEAAAIGLLERARRPLLAVGLTAARFNARRMLNDFLASFPMPVVLTPMAKGIIPEDHPCYAGILFHALSDYLEDLYRKTDLVIGLGYDQVEYNYESWIPAGVPLLHFDTKVTDMPGNVSYVSYTGMPAGWFGILKNLNRDSLVFEPSVIRGIRDEMESVFNGFTSGFGPVTALKVLREELPGETIVTADVGSHLHLIGQFWRTPSPDKLIITNGWSSMGFGIPAAVAVSLNRPGLTVACITGDGGFLMSPGELLTARRYRLPVKVIVFSDAELNLISLKQSWKDIRPYGTTLYDGDLFGSEIFLGVKVIRASSEIEMREAVRSALKIDEPVIINAVIDPEDYRWLVSKPR